VSSAPKIELFFELFEKMLLDLIEHQRELFAAVIGILNYRDLCALRAACRGLFTVISCAHRWQHMHNFADSLTQINSMRRTILCDDNDNDIITIMYHKNDIICYCLQSYNNKLIVYSTKYRMTYDNFIMDYYPVCALVMSNFISDTNAPKWLLECINEIVPTGANRTRIIDIRPSSAGEGGLGS
jgi:hypothetical protein